MLLALGSKPIKVRLIDHARHERRQPNETLEPDRVLRLKWFTRHPDRDRVWIKYRDGRETGLRPDQIRLKENLAATP